MRRRHPSGVTATARFNGLGGKIMINDRESGLSWAVVGALSRHMLTDDVSTSDLSIRICVERTALRWANGFPTLRVSPRVEPVPRRRVVHADMVQRSCVRGSGLGSGTPKCEVLFITASPARKAHHPTAVERGGGCAAGRAQESGAIVCECSVSCVEPQSPSTARPSIPVVNKPE